MLNDRDCRRAKERCDVTGADIKLARNACHAPSVLPKRDILQSFTSYDLLFDIISIFAKIYLKRFE